MLYQVLRRSCLALSCAALLIVPAWHLAHLASGTSTPDGEGRWAGLADTAGLTPYPPPVLGTPWSFRISNVECLDPLAGVSLLIARGGGASILIAMLPWVVLVALLGRFFCGWLCPYVPILAAANGLRGFLGRVEVRLPEVRLGRSTPFVVLASVLLLTALGGAVIAPLFYPPAILGRQLFRAVYFGGIGAGLTVVVLAFLLDTFVSPGGFCTSLCPGGALFRVIGVFSPVRVQRDRAACERCGSCDVVCRLAQSPMTDRLDSGCERCGKCVAVCPEGALRLTVGKPLARLVTGEDAE
jgi:ferredoxin-type protein NapH